MSMKRIRVKVAGSGEPGNPFRVELPTYVLIPGTEKYKDAEKKVLASVEVLVPADECDEKGSLSKAKIRAKYKGQPRWDHKDVAKDIQPAGFEPAPVAVTTPEPAAAAPAAEQPESLLSRIKKRLRG